MFDMWVGACRYKENFKTYESMQVLIRFTDSLNSNVLSGNLASFYVIWHDSVHVSSARGGCYVIKY